MDVTSFTAQVGDSYTLLADFSVNSNVYHNMQLMIGSHDKVELAWSADPASPFYTLPAGFTTAILPNFLARGKVYARVTSNEPKDVTINIW